MLLMASIKSVKARGLSLLLILSFFSITIFYLLSLPNGNDDDDDDDDGTTTIIHSLCIWIWEPILSEVWKSSSSLYVMMVSTINWKTSGPVVFFNSTVNLSTAYDQSTGLPTQKSLHSYNGQYNHQNNPCKRQHQHCHNKFHQSRQHTNTKMPLHLHLTFSTSSEHEIILHFTTLQEEAGTPVALFWKNTENMRHKKKLDDYNPLLSSASASAFSKQHKRSPAQRKVQGTSTTLQKSQMCGSPANSTFFQKVQQLHTVVLPELESDTRYQYQAGIALGQGIIWSEDIYSFLSPSSTVQIDTIKSKSSMHRGLRSSKELNQLDESSSSSSSPSIATSRIASTFPYTYLVLTDQGTTEMAGWSSRAITQQIKGRNNMQHQNQSSTTIRSIHHIGGLSSAQGRAHLWDEWWEHIVQSYAAQVPLMIGVGNLEYDQHEHAHSQSNPSNGDSANDSLLTDQPPWKISSPPWSLSNSSGGECGQIVRRQFFLDKLFQNSFESISDTNTSWHYYYSYNEGPWLHTIVLNSEQDLSPGSTQYLWLEDDLKKVTESNYNSSASNPWIVVELYRPLYHNQAKWDDNRIGLILRRQLEHLFRSYNVHLVLSGHYGTYFTSCSGLWQSQCHNGGPTYITLGSSGLDVSGADLDWYDASWARPYAQKFSKLGVNYHFGYGQVTIHNQSTLEFQWIPIRPNRTDDVSDLIVDRLWIRR